jgi:hypothetical protein
MFANAAISWQSTRQQIITLSSTEAELVALNELTREMAWISIMMESIGLKSRTPLIVHQDNMSTEAIANDLSNTRRTKHLDVRQKYVTQCIERKLVEIRHCPTTDMIADIFTKPLESKSFERQRNALGLVSLSTLRVKK